jgi:phosphoglycerol transferase
VQATQNERQLWRRLAWCLAAVVGSLLVLVRVLRLWKADLHVPLIYNTDAPLTLSWIKGIMDNGWYLHNRFLGAPFGQDLHDFPMADSLNFLTIKLLGWIWHDAAIVHNLFYILGFPLTALTALLVLRHFKVAPWPAFVAAMLFAFLPTHFLRLGHLFLSAYYLIPPMMMIALWIYLGDAPFFTGGEHKRSRLALWNGKALVSGAVCVLVSSQGIYYAFFACFFVLVAGLSSCLNRRVLYPLCSSLMLAGIISLGVLANLAPSWLYQQQHGSNVEVARRFPLESEAFALKMTQMMLPVADHRLGFLADLRKKYDENCMPLVNENGFAVLGLTATIGLCLLLGRVLLWKRSSAGPDLHSGLLMLTVLAILLGTIGGFSSLFSVYITPQIRCWNRISLYIGFFSLFGLALLWQRWLHGLAHSPARRVLSQIGLGVLLVFGVLDQTTKSFIPDYASLKQQYGSDRSFVRRIEASTPEEAMIFQLPYLAYPEAGRRFRLGDYEPLKGYLHSRKLRWSHGPMKGREADMIIRSVALLAPEKMLHAVALAGFSGIYVDREGYADHGAGVEAQLTRMLSAPPLVSDDQKRAYFNLVDFATALRQSLPAAEWQNSRQRLLSPITALFQKGFSYGGDAPENPARWCGPEGIVCLHNPRSQPRRVRLELVCEAYQPLAHLALRGPLLARDYEIRNGALTISEDFTIPPGSHALHLHCDAQRIVSPGDLRVLVFYVKSLVISELD